MKTKNRVKHKHGENGKLHESYDMLNRMDHRWAHNVQCRADMV
jgi:hypothetical protein